METVIEVKNLKRDYVTYKGVIRKKKETIHAVKDISFSSFIFPPKLIRIIRRNHLHRQALVNFLRRR